jgi:hypothetical protein
MRRLFFRLPSTLIFLFALGAVVAAQERDRPKVEVGVQFSSLSVTPPERFAGTENRPGFGGRATYDLTEHLAVEGEVNFFPTRGFETSATGGRALQGQFGLKAGRRFEKFGVFAKARPGFVSFAETREITPTTVTVGGQTFPTVIFDTGRKTHFSFDVGGVLEFYPTRRTTVRFDAGDTIIRYGERRDLGPIFAAPGGLLITAPAETRHNFQFTAGVGFRLGGGDGGEVTPSRADDGDATRFEAGIQFSALLFNPPSSAPRPAVFGTPRDEPVNTEAGFGGRFAVNLSEHVAVEAEGNFYPREGFSDDASGGYPSQMQFGLKAGRRFERFGLFAKARPGFVSFSNALILRGTRTFTLTGPGGQQQQVTVGDFDTGRRTFFSTDLGGVLEFYPARRLVTRFDFGDTIIRYGTRHLPGFGVVPGLSEIPPATKHNFQFSAGLAIRF